MTIGKNSRRAAMGIMMIASAGGAQTVDWNKDPLAGFRSALSDAGAPPAAPAFAPAKGSETPTGPVAAEIVADASAFALSAEDIVRAAKTVPSPGSALGLKMASLMKKAYAADAAPSAPPDAEVLHVVTWNINDPQTDADISAVAQVIEGDASGLSKTDDRILGQLEETSKGDVFMLQEIGLKAARELSSRLRMSMAWAPEFIEVGVNAAGRDPEAGEVLSGNAILSRYPLSDVRILRFHDQADWFEDEKNPSALEKGKQAANKKFFGGEANVHETRPPMPFGGRMSLMAKARISYRTAASSGEEICLIDVHMENKSKPQLRRKQMAEVIAAVKGAGMPVIFGGDLNTVGNDGRNVTVMRLLLGQVDTPGKAADTALGQVIQWTPYLNFIPYAGYIKQGWGVYKFFKAKEDPTSILNPDHKIFGDLQKKLGVHPTNERDKIGYKHTWATDSPKQITAAILDWLFLYDPAGGGMRIAESKTFEELINDSNGKGEERVSDHSPVRALVALRPPQP